MARRDGRSWLSGVSTGSSNRNEADARPGGSLKLPFAACGERLGEILLPACTLALVGDLLISRHSPARDLSDRAVWPESSMMTEPHVIQTVGSPGRPVH